MLLSKALNKLFAPSFFITLVFPLLSFLLLFALQASSLAQDPLWQGKGRIVYSCDGNEHDNDDWGSSAFSLALLAAKGLQEHVPLVIYSNHIWGSNHDFPMSFGKSAYEQMRESVLTGGELFGFGHTHFLCAVDNAEASYEALKAQIDSSSEDNPLIIISAGPLQVEGEAVHRADKDKLKWVTIVSHGRANAYGSISTSGWENHTGWTWDQIKEYAEPEGMKFFFLPHQNGGKDYEGLQTDKNHFDWVITSKARKNPCYRPGSWDWLYTRLVVSMRRDGKRFDISDSGLVLYVLTGTWRTNPTMVKEILENPVGE